MLNLFECTFLKPYEKKKTKTKTKKTQKRSISNISFHLILHEWFVCVSLLFFRELQAMFKVKDVPTVVVLRPDGSVISPNAVQDICRFGADRFRDWQEAAELIERSFMLNEEFDNLNLRSATDPVRRLKYKTEDDKRKTRWWKPWGKGKDKDEEERGKDGSWDTKRKEGDKGTWRRII